MWLHVNRVELLGHRHRRWIVEYNQGVHQVCMEGEGSSAEDISRE